MSSPTPDFDVGVLDTLILAAFRQARLEGATVAAEHLLRALEALAVDAGSTACASTCLDDAYLSLVEPARGVARSGRRNTM